MVKKKEEQTTGKNIGKNMCKIEQKLQRKHLIALSFFLPLLVMTGCCIVFGVQPFGDNSLLIIDGLHQYMPFYSVLYDKLKGGETLFYSFRSGLGINFLSLFSYYLSSPFNLLILFFKKSQLNMAVSMIIVLKIACSGMTAGIYFSSKSKKQGFSIVMISMAYALSSYMVGYCWNVMWLDAIMIFPIIMMGLERLIEKKDGRLYCIALFYALYCNYYIAFMICIFAVIWYLLYSFKSIKQFFFRGIAFAFYSFLAAVIEITVTAFMGFNENGQISVSKFFYGTEDMEKATESLKDGTFYRSELASALMVDENAWYPINSVGLFGSTATDRMVTIMDNLGFYTGCNEYLYKGATPVTNFLLNVKYLYYHQEDSLQTDFQYVKSEGSFDIYENPAKGMSIGYLMNRSVKDWYYDSAYPFRVQNDLGEQAFGVSELFHNIRISDPETNGCTASRTNDGEYYFEYKDSRPDNMTFTIPITKNVENLYLFYDGTQVENAQISVDGVNVKSGDIDGYMLPIGKAAAGSEVKVTFELKGETEDGYVRLSAADFDQQAYGDLKKIVATRAFSVDRYSDRLIEGSVNAAQDQTLFFSIPYDKGWKVIIDGKEAKTHKIGDAFLGVNISSGKHKVSLKYTPPGFTVGWKITVLSAAIFLILCKIIHSRKLRQLHGK